MILVDTPVVVWLAFDPSQLSAKGKAAIEDARLQGGGLALSDITLLELAILSSRGRIRLGISLESFLTEVEARFTVLPISAGRACGRWRYQPPTPKIRRIELLAPQPWSKDSLCLPRTVKFVGRGHFPPFGEKALQLSRADRDPMVRR